MTASLMKGVRHSITRLKPISLFMQHCDHHTEDRGHLEHEPVLSHSNSSQRPPQLLVTFPIASKVRQSLASKPSNLETPCDLGNEFPSHMRTRNVSEDADDHNLGFFPNSSNQEGQQTSHAGCMMLCDRALFMATVLTIQNPSSSHTRSTATGGGLVAPQEYWQKRKQSIR